ncbi:MAG: hypothetical protein KAT22_00320 [Candidatus Thorarchaeota archaeon]|nr:hypothetical protein [Candidatus Thorarchaeota archaeon]
MTPYNQFTEAIVDLFTGLSNALIPFGIPFGPIAWFVIVVTVPMVAVIAFLLYRIKGSAGGLPDGVQRIIASTGDVSSGIAGTKKVRFIKTPGEALVFLKVEENAVQQALTAVDYYTKEGEIDSSLQDKLVSLYQGRLIAVQAAIAKDEELKAVVDADSAMDRARSDYLRKLAAMSGTTVEADTAESGPPSVGAPSAAEVMPSDGAAPSVGPPSGGAPPSGGTPPGGGAPSGGPPGGGAPSGGSPPGGGAPSADAPSGAPSGGPPGGGAPSGGGPPGGGAPSSGPPGDAPSSGIPSGPPSGGVPSGPPGGALSEKPSGAPGKSSLQSEMLAEMERLRTLMSGD